MCNTFGPTSAIQFWGDESVRRRVLPLALVMLVALVLSACGEAFQEGFREGLEGQPPSPPAQDQPQGQQAQQQGEQTAPDAEEGQAPAQDQAGKDTDQQQSEKSALPPGVTQAKVVRVIDGDTIEVAYVAGAKLPATRVRLIGVDTPESTTRVEPYGKEAAAYTEKQLEGKTVWLEKDVSETDRYGRALRYVWLTKPPADPTEKDIRTHLFNAILVLNGYAQVATYPPDVKYVEHFTKFQREARDANKGLWGLAASGGSSTQKSSSSSSSTGNSSASKSGGSKSTAKKSGGSSSSRKCDPNYSGACVPPYPPDVDCGDLSAKGFRVVGTDVHRLDRDKDGLACESD